MKDAICATDAGADFLGFIFYKKSPRYLTPDRAAQIASGLVAHISPAASRPDSMTPPPRLPRLVGVFVNETLTTIQETIGLANLDYAQLHGDEPPALLESLQGRGFKALRPTSAAEAAIDAEWYAGLGPVDGPQFLIDAFDPVEYGGTGKRADWQAAAALRALYPRLALAGGLTPDNVHAAVQAVRPWAVDVSSGVEIEPGRKDPQKVRAFISAARSGAPQTPRANAE